MKNGFNASRKWSCEMPPEPYMTMVARAEKNIAADTQVVTYFVEAAQSDYVPLLDPDVRLAAERKAVFLIALTYGLLLLPTAHREIEAIPKLAVLLKHKEFLITLFRITNLNYPEFAPRVDNRTDELLKLSRHSDKEDCRILAEAEILQSDTLLTFDGSFQRRLQPHARIPLRKPSEFKIAPDTPRKFSPAWDNPKSQQGWWKSARENT